MQRLIKFRAWDKKRKKMYYDAPEVNPKNCGKLVYCDMENLAIGLDSSLYWIDECGNCEYPANFKVQYELMQYTGLKDKNGKEIYGGDILQMAGKVRQPRWEVVWYENGWQVKLAWIKERLPENYYVKLSSDEVVEFDEVIGNIYENPELLEENK